MKIYHTAAQEDYDALMIELEEKGRKWLGGVKPTQLDEFKNYGKDTYIYDDSGVLSFSDGYYFKAYCSNETLIEYKAKGENMLNTECKQCHKKWHHDNAKYCSMCGKKLIDESEFKVGDIVASQCFSDDSFGLVKLNEDLINRLATVNGLWYTKDDCTIGDMSLGIFKEDTRHATPEEIAEYEVALSFHKHGREPFEVKNGDLIRAPSEKKYLVGNPENYTKEKFLDYGWKLLKTAEEIDEWLGVADE